MMRQPRVSIVIPVRNGGELLDLAVRSCLEGTDERIEVLVVDDGGTDGAPERVAGLGAAVHVLRQDWSGAPAARNRGLAASRGVTVKFLDADDELEPGALDAQCRTLDGVGADVVYGDFLMTGRSDDSRIGGVPHRRPGAVDDVGACLLEGWWCAVFCYLVRRDVARGCRWDEDLRGFQDLDFVHQLAARGARFHYAPGTVGRYRMHSGQITQAPCATRAAARVRVARRALARIESQHELSRRERLALGHLCWIAARECRRVRDEGWRDALAALNVVAPGFVPRSGAPWPVRVLTGLLGFERAERILDIRRSLVGRAVATAAEAAL